MSNKALYKKICDKHPEVQLFSRPWWLDTVCGDWDAAIAMKGEHVSGVWAYPLEKKLGVTLLRSPMMTPYLGPQVFFPKDLKESNADNYEHATVSELIKQLPNAQVWDLAIQPGMKQAGLFKAQGLQSQVKQTFLLELKESEETLLANMQDSMRRNIRLAETEVIISDSPKYLHELYHFQKAVLAKKGKKIPYSFKFLQKALDACIAHQSGSIWAAIEAKNQKKVYAVVWQVWDNNTSYYLMGGHNLESNSYRSMSLLLWHTMREAKKRGHSAFDLEGSMDEGVERFFRSFGGERALYIVLKKNQSLVWKMKEAIFK